MLTPTHYSAVPTSIIIMLPFKYMAVLAYLALVYGQDDYDYEPAPRPAPARIQPGYSGPSAAKPTPVPILKQINRHHEDGSYTYGYEGADGSFKIETKLPTGEVKGKYGYVDDTGKVRVVEYGATKYGFEPAGEGITVAPPTLVDETTNRDGSINPQYTGAYYNDEPQSQPQPQPQQHHIRVAPARPRPQLQQSFEYSGPQQFTSASQRNSAPLPQRTHISGASPSLVSHHDFEFGSNPQQPERSFAPQRNYAPQRSFAPTPPRASPTFTFAQPAQTDEDDSSYEQAPAPIRSSPRITYAEPNHLSEPRAFAPAPRPASPQYASSRPSPSISGRSGGILDQLSKDYALPQGGAAPLHDISFGYY